MKDGNLLRVVYATVREGLRSVLLSRTVEHLQIPKKMKSDVHVIHRAPSNASIRYACEKLSSNDNSFENPPIIVYPEPVLSDGQAESMIALADYYLPETQLVTLSQLRLMRLKHGINSHQKATV